jgi:predicted acylesterase/phospholipase RssA
MVNKIGLALSGGGFRATLYHLGLVRFLRDAGVLPSVSHITAVSGGSIFAAHLCLNWDRYNSSPGEFDAAASELLSFVRMDVRNRILRRYPLGFPLRWPRRLLGRSIRKLTRTGLLEWHYEKYLFGDISLFELPEKPQLHILATNLSEGCLCSFNRNGLMMVRRQPGTTFRIDRIHVGLATVAMAVTASSAFPGFFPPLELTGADVGATAGEFGRQAYTDGGVFDNLGVRMFRWLERPLLADTPLSQDDFFDFQAVVEALKKASKSNKETPLRRLTQIMVAACNRPDLLLLTNGSSSSGEGVQQIAGPGMGGNRPHSTHSHGAGNGNTEAAMLSVLGDLLRHYQFHREPLFSALKPLDHDAESLLVASRPGGRNLDAGDQLWLNRHLLEAAFRQATGKACFRRLNSGLDGVLVSDVGKAIEVQANRRAGGLIRTSLRSTDILMDRVWQLEMETFQDTPGFVFVPMTDVIEPSEDPTALHPEIQRQVARIRTDLDRFSLLEISSIVRHGYCVGRKACRVHPDLFGAELPNNAPWDPIPGHHDTARAVSAAARPARSLLSPLLRTGAEERGEPAAATVEARTLQASAFRRIWSTLLDYRDWVSYVYVPLIVPILILLPLVIYKFYQRSHIEKRIAATFVQGNYELDLLTGLLENGPAKRWTGVPAEEVRTLGYTDLTGYEVLQNSWVIDLRSWSPAEAAKPNPSTLVHVYRRIKVHKQLDTAVRYFRIPLFAVSPQTEVRFPKQQLEGTLRRCNVEGLDPEDKEVRWEASFDFHAVPVGDYVDLYFEYQSPGTFLNPTEKMTEIVWDVSVPTAETTMWILMPEGTEYKGFRVNRYLTGQPEKVEPVKVVTEYLANDYTILAFKLQPVKKGYTYGVAWYYK